MNNQPHKKSSRLEKVVGGLVIVGLIAISIITTFETIEDYLTRDSWEETTATVVKINSKTHWLTYQYEVESDSYIGTRLNITEDTRSWWEIPDEAQDYPEGRPLTVFYNPDKPWRAVISPTADFTGIVLVFVGILFIIIGYVVVRRLLLRYLRWVGNVLSGKQWEDIS